MSPGQVAGPTQTASDELHTTKWEGQPWVARLLRFGIFIFPLVVSILASLWASHTYPPERVGVNRWVWWLGLAILAMCLVRSLERLMTKLAPLTMLFRLSLIFPDQAPSRFSVALKTGSTRSVKRRLAEIQESGELFSDEETYSEQMLELVAVLAQHDRMTRGHAERVRAYSELIGEEMGLNPEDLGKLRWSALLHDMGKLHVPSEILNKDGRPTDEEWAVLKEHPAKSEEYLEPLADWLGDWRFAAVGHHERWDGGGYPAGQAGLEIPLSARIVAVADAYDVMTSTRSYKKPMPAELARQEVADKAGTQFDPVVSRAFMSIGLGDLRRTAGPLAFFANLPFIRGLPLGNAITTIASSAVTAVTTGIVVVTNAVAGVPDTPPPPEPLAFNEPSAPVIAANDISGFEDSAITGSIAASGEGPFTVVLTNGPQSGNVSLGQFSVSPAELEYVYTPEPDAFGQDSFDVRVCDTNNLCSDETVNINVAPVDDRPEIAEPVLTIDEGATESFSLDVSDADGDQLSISILDAPDNATVTSSGTNITITHDGSETSTIAFTLVLTDGTTNIEQPVVVQVTPTNDAPVGMADSIAAVENQAVEIATADLLINDTDAENTNLAVSSVGLSPDGTVTLLNDVITFTPDPDFVGSTTFVYFANDGSLDSDPVEVTVVVTAKQSEPPTINLAPFDATENDDGATVATVTGTDPEGGPITFAVTGGTGVGVFAVDASSGEITISGPIDFEATPTLTVEVTATDEDGVSTSTVVTVTVVDVNEPPVFVAPQALSIAEDSGLGDLVTNSPIVANDPEGDRVNFTLVDLSGAFKIDPDSGDISLAATILDFETTSAFSVTIVATDTGSGERVNLPIQIAVLDVNDPPTVSPLVLGPLTEATEKGTVVGAVDATDADEDKLTFAIVGGTGQVNFAIDSDSGEITLTDPLDFESAPELTLDIAVSDNGDPKQTTTLSGVVVAVTDANDAPVVTVGQTLSIDENTDEGDITAGGPIVATDQDPGDEAGITFSITDSEGLFVIDENTGEVSRTAVPLDFEKLATHTVQVTATDPSGASGFADVAIRVDDVNDAPVITLPAGPFQVPENTTGIIVGATPATDADEGDKLSYALTGTGSSAFNIDDNGVITLVNPLDHEATPQLTLQLKVKDDDVNPITVTTPIVIDVSDVNEEPTVAANQIFRIVENSDPDTLVDPSTIIASDIDEDSLDYYLDDPTDTFQVDLNSGVISLKGAVDFDTDPNTYPVTITVDDGDFSVSATATINVVDVNEPPEVSGPTGLVTIAENSVSATLVTDSISAFDQESDTLRFTLDDASGLFQIDSSTGVITTAGPTIDYETLPNEHEVTVTVDDRQSGGASDVPVTFTIEVLPKNERPMIVTEVIPMISEDTAADTVVFTKAGADPDDGDTLKWSAPSGTGTAIFSIDANTGDITLLSAVDFDTQPTSYTLDLVLTDAEGLFDTQTITFNFSNVNEGPTIAGPTDLPVTTSENLPSDTFITSDITATDPDAGASLEFGLDDPSGLFKIDTNTGMITSAVALDFEMHTPPALHTVTVWVTDGALRNDVTFDIEIVDQNERPEIDPFVNPTLPESFSPAVVMTLTGNDPDRGDTPTWSLTGGTGESLFTIDSLTGDIELTGQLDYDTMPTPKEYTLDVVLSDGDLDDTATVVIAVSDVNEPPVLDALQTFTIVENSPAGTIATDSIGNQAAPTFSDPENDPITSWSMTDPTGSFDIDSTTGEIYNVAATLDYEGPQRSYDVDVTATGTPGPPSTETVTIEIVDLNEAPTILGPADISIPEDRGTGIIGSFSVDNPENEALAFTITGGTGAGGLFDVDSSTGDITLVGEVDHDTTPSYSLEVRVADQADATRFSDFTLPINIDNVNEAPALDPTVVYEIPEDANNDDLVSPTVVATDPDAVVTTFTYALDDPSGTFRIDPQTGEISLVAGPLDADTTATYPVTFSVSDNDPLGALTFEYSGSITVTNINEVPTVNIPIPGLTVDEGLGPDTVVGSVTATDQENDDLEFSMGTVGSGAGLFNIDAAGVVTTVQEFDFEALIAPHSFDIEVIATETSTPEQNAGTQMITIRVNDVNDAPVVTSGQVFSIVDSAAPGALLAGGAGDSIVLATDADGPTPDTLSYAITGGTGQANFSIDPDTGELALANAIDFDDGQQYTLDIVVTDDGSPARPSVRETVTVNVESQFGTLSPHAGDIIFNEVRFTAFETSPTGTNDIPDFVEIRNLGANDQSFNGWILTDAPLGDATSKFQINYSGLTSVAADDYHVQWFADFTNLAADAPAAGSESWMVAASAVPRSEVISTNDDLFLYDDNGLLVAYMAWGDVNDPASDIGVRPPMNEWDLWDPTFEAQLTHTTTDSVALTPDSTNPHLSGCWERTSSGTANASGNCAVPGASVDTDPDPALNNSVGTSNEMQQPLGNLVISEFSVMGMAGTPQDNWVEVYNASPNDVDLTTMKLEFHVNGVLRDPNSCCPGVELLLSRSGSADFLPPGGHVLLVQTGASATYANNADGTFDLGLGPSLSSLRIVDTTDGSVVDTVGFVDGPFEGNPLPITYRVPGRPQSFERLQRGCVDTDNNQTDFHRPIDIVTPMNRSAQPQLCVPVVWDTTTPRPPIVISEVQNGISAYATTGFVELFNPTAVSQALTGRSIMVEDQQNSQTYIINLVGTLEPGERVIADLIGQTIPRQAHIDIFEGVDLAAALDPANAIDEVTISEAPGGLPTFYDPDKSYQRRNGGCEYTGPGQLQDFEWRAPPTETGAVGPAC